MQKAEQIQEQIKNLGLDVKKDFLNTQKEIKHLSDVLTETETIKAITEGFVSSGTMLIVCTERRVVFLDKGLLYGLKQSETPIQKISSIEHKTGLLMGEIGIWDGAAKTTIKNVRNKAVMPFVDALNIEIEKTRSSGGVKPSDVAEQLTKLSKLLKDGVLTDEEFQAQKKKLLG